MSIIFKEETHQYFNTETGREYLSGTKFIHLFEPPFDKDTISKRVALKEGKTQQEVLDEWAAISKQACDYGTATHLLMENYIKFGEESPENEILYKTFKKCVGKDYNFAETIHSEKLLWNDDGTPTARTGKILAGTPMGRFGETEELIGATLFLMSEEASGFVDGVVIPIDGGYAAYSGV